MCILSSRLYVHVHCISSDAENTPSLESVSFTVILEHKLPKYHKFMPNYVVGSETDVDQS